MTTTRPAAARALDLNHRTTTTGVRTRRRALFQRKGVFSFQFFLPP
jgi:hypothetical protein